MTQTSPTSTVPTSTTSLTLPDADIVGLAGDWHGNTAWAQNVIRTLAQSGVKHIYHLGDFGIWPGHQGEAFLRHVNAAAKHFGVSVLVTPGNHEDYDQIDALDDAGFGLAPVAPFVSIIPRGLRWTQSGRSFVSLGGAPSIDFEYRQRGVSWWPQEAITYNDVTRVAQGGHADIMLAHDAPDGGTEAVQQIIDTPASKSPWSTAGLAYASEGRMLMNEAVAAVAPSLFAHGHYHAPDDTGPITPCRYLSLGCDGQTMSACLLRLADLAVSWDGSTFT